MGTVSQVVVEEAAVWIKNDYSGGTYAQVGYTEDGATFTYTPDVAMIDVHEETVPINAVLAAEDMKIAFTFAETVQLTMDNAMAGSSASNDVITLGGGTIQKVGVALVYSDPEQSGEYVVVELPCAVSTGAIVLPFKRDGKTMFPVEYTATIFTGTACLITKDVTSATPPAA